MTRPARQRTSGSLLAAAAFRRKRTAGTPPSASALLAASRRSKESSPSCSMSAAIRDALTVVGGATPSSNRDWPRVASAHALIAGPSSHAGALERALALVYQVGV